MRSELTSSLPLPIVPPPSHTSRSGGGGGEAVQAKKAAGAKPGRQLRALEQRWGVGEGKGVTRRQALARSSKASQEHLQGPRDGIRA